MTPATTVHRVSTSPDMARRGAHAVAVARPVADLLAGPVREAEVIGVLPAVVYLRVGSSGRVLAVAAAHGLVLPCALVVARPAGARPFARIAVGGRAWIGDGRLRLPDGSTLTRGRVFDPRPTLATCEPARCAASADVARAWIAHHVAAPDRALGGRIAAWERACHDGDVGARRSAAEGLLGYGAGLTPSGDDVLAGTLAAAALLDGPAAAPLARTGAEIVRVADHHTPVVSAALLGHAVHGEVVGPAADLLDALTRNGAQDAEIVAVVRRLVDVGHSSGRDLAIGVLLGVALSIPQGRG